MKKNNNRGLKTAVPATFWQLKVNFKGKKFPAPCKLKVDESGISAKDRRNFKHARRKFNSRLCSGKPSSPRKKTLAEMMKNENV